MPLHLTLSTAGDARKTAGTLFSTNLYLAVGDLTVTTPWVSIIDAPTFLSTEVGLENLLGLRKPTVISYAYVNAGTSETFVISNISVPTWESGYFRLVSPTKEYCVWLDRTGYDLDPSNDAQVSVRVLASGSLTQMRTALATSINGLAEYTAVVSSLNVNVTTVPVGICHQVEVTTGFVFTTGTTGAEAGKFSHNGSLWSLTNTPTTHIYFKYLIDYTDLTDKTLYQFGLYRSPVINGGVASGKMLLFPADLTDLGEFQGGVNSYPVKRSLTKLNIFSFIITI